jgi:hypothetical protein
LIHSRQLCGQEDSKINPSGKEHCAAHERQRLLQHYPATSRHSVAQLAGLFGANLGTEGFRPYQATFFAAGIFHVPLMIEGDFSLGQYMRSIRTNLPDGAGSQFDSLSAPGDWFWM